MEVVPRSHLVDIDRSKLDIASEKPDFLSNDSEMTFFPTTGDPCRPLVVEVRPGDVLVFDLRLLHRGHPEADVTEEEKATLGEKAKRFTRNKATISFVYGLDNFQSQRYHSSFRYHRRDSKFREPAPEFSVRLAHAGLLLSTWNENFLDKDELARTDLFVSENMKKMIAAPPSPEGLARGASKTKGWFARAKRYVARIVGA